MKRVIRHTLQTIEAMALINPQMSKQLTIQAEVVQGGEEPIPHIHVYHDKTRTTCSYIRLDCPKYSDHHDDCPKLPRKLVKEFIMLMNELWTGYIIKSPTGYRPATGYEAAVYIWADTYENGDMDKFNLDESGELIVPDYSQLR